MERPRIEQMISVLQQTERQYLDLLPILQKEKQMIISARLDDIQKVSEEKGTLAPRHPAIGVTSQGAS